MTSIQKPEALMHAENNNYLSSKGLLQNPLEDMSLHFTVRSNAISFIMDCKQECVPLQTDQNSNSTFSKMSVLWKH